jgi:predicted dehydrogenase
MAADGGGSLSFLVVGCGSIGQRHIGNLLGLNAGRILACDVRSDRRDEVKIKFGVEPLECLERAWKLRPDVALITVPTSMHVPLALEAAENGCHLLIEKPLSDRIDGIDQLLSVVRNRKLVTLVACNMRFHPGLLKVKTLLEERAIGRVVAARVEVGQYLPDWHPWEDYRQGYSARRDLGGGVILDAIHEIDYARWMLGEVEAVTCFTGNLSHLEIDTEDTAAILLRFLNGTIGEIHMDYVQRAYSRTCQIIGEEGTIRWDCAAGEVRWYSATAQQWQIFRDPSGWEPNQMYLDEMRHFLKCLSGEESAALNISEAVRVLEIALAAKAASNSGKVISLTAWEKPAPEPSTTKSHERV